MPSDVMSDRRRFSVSEAADVLGVADRTVYRMIERGDLGAIKPGRGYTITRSHLREYVGSEEALSDLEATSNDK
jgi:excisionase family DNA binding protein